MENTDQHEKFMRMAIAYSEDNVRQQVGTPFGAVIVKEGKCIAGSANLVARNSDPTAHAEVSAIRLACQKLQTVDLKGCIIYTSCEPCPMCLGAIYWSGIDQIYYANTKVDAAAIGFSDQQIEEEIKKSADIRSKPTFQILRTEAIKAFQQWESENHTK